jgi:hypothetical protein
MSGLKEVIYYLIGKPYIPSKLLIEKEKKLLHISDTPICFYSKLKRLIEKLKPDYIVHTGDFTDNIKLELHPDLIQEHEKGIKVLAPMLEASGAKVILAVGNHDNIDVINKYFEKSHIIMEAETMNIEGLSFRISHFPEGVQGCPSRYNLFGHDLTLKNGCIDNKFYFNGIAYMNIIGLESGGCTTLYYPSRIDDARLGRRKSGL